MNISAHIVGLAREYLRETGLSAAEALRAASVELDEFHQKDPTPTWGVLPFRSPIAPGVPHLREWLAEKGERELGAWLSVIIRLVDLANKEKSGRSSVIRWGVAGYNATTRTRRMVEDAVRKYGIELTAKDAASLRTWDPSTLPLDARIVFLGCLRILTESGMLPDLPPNKPITSLEPVLVPVPEGFSRLADACGYDRTEESAWGASVHGKAARRQMKNGLENLLGTARDIFHHWEEWDPKEKRSVRRYQRFRSTIAQLVDEGTVERRAGSQRELFLSPHALFIAIHPAALLGARQHYAEIPGDFLSRYRHALETLAERGKNDARTRELVGARPRMTDTDLEFLTWCYMHRGRVSVPIAREKVMDRIGLGGYLEQRKRGVAERMLARAELIALEVGALEETATTGEGVTTYIMPSNGRGHEPAGLPDGTIPLFDE